MNVKRTYIERAAFCAFVENILGIQVSYSFGHFVFSHFEVFPVTFSDAFSEEHLRFQTLARNRCYVFPNLAWCRPYVFKVWREVAFTFSSFGVISPLRFQGLAQWRLYAFKHWRVNVLTLSPFGTKLPLCSTYCVLDRPYWGRPRCVSCQAQDPILDAENRNKLIIQRESLMKLQY